MKKIVFLLCPIMIIILCFFCFKQLNIKSVKKQNNNSENVSIDYSVNFSQFVKTIKATQIYNSSKKKVGAVSPNVILELDTEYEVKDKYYRLKDTDYYIKYDSVEICEKQVYNLVEYETYKNYILFNQNIKTKNSYKLYYEDQIQYDINEIGDYSIIIKDEEKYGVEFNGRLFYIYKSDVESIYNKTNTDLNHADAVAVLNYHYAIDANSDEAKECLQSICLPETQIDEEIKYLHDNNFYAVTMEDLYLFVSGKIQLPEKSVSITIDDGWYVGRMISILEKYQMIGTLFLIGWLDSPNAYSSSYLEIHSHTWNMHTPGVCSGGYGGGILCLDEASILEDLKKSRESLNNTEFFCYPFYEYNNRAIELLKKSGFKMAFAGGERKTKPGDNLFKVPRFALQNSTTINQFISYVN